MNRARAVLLSLSSALLAIGACGGPQKLGDGGSTCFRDDDCAAGLICVAPTEKDTHRVCSNDPTPLISTVKGPPVMTMGGAAGMAGMAAAAGTAAAGSESGGSETGGAGGGGKSGGGAGGKTSGGSGGSGGNASGGVAGKASGGSESGTGGSGTAGTGGTAPEAGAPP